MIPSAVTPHPMPSPSPAPLRGSRPPPLGWTLCGVEHPVASWAQLSWPCWQSRGPCRVTHWGVTSSILTLKQALGQIHSVPAGTRTALPVLSACAVPQLSSALLQVPSPVCGGNSRYQRCWESPPAPSYNGMPWGNSPGMEVGAWNSVQEPCDGSLVEESLHEKENYPSALLRGWNPWKNVVVHCLF